MKEVYNPKAVIPHAALLDQASAHCPIFPTAASRRSLGRVSVPVWPVTLSGRLPVKAMVGHYPTIKLIGREHIPYRKNFPPHNMRHRVISGINFGFPKLSRSTRQITHVLLTRSPLEYPRKGLSARLACVKHAASVRPEPGSNSPSKTNSPKEKTNLTTNTELSSRIIIKPPTQNHPKAAKDRQGKSIHRLSHTVEFSKIRRAGPTLARGARAT